VSGNPPTQQQAQIGLPWLGTEAAEAVARTSRCQSRRL